MFVYTVPHERGSLVAGLTLGLQVKQMLQMLMATQRWCHQAPTGNAIRTRPFKYVEWHVYDRMVSHSASLPSMHFEVDNETRTTSYTHTHGVELLSLYNCLVCF